MRLRERVVSRDLILSWIETGLRSVGGIEDKEDLVSLELNDIKADALVKFKVSPKELQVETILHSNKREEEEYLANGKRKKLSQGVRRLPCETRTEETSSTKEQGTP